MNSALNATDTTKSFYERAYSEQGLSAQRKYPNEEFLRFLGRNFSHMNKQQKAELKLLEVGSGSGANLWVPAREGFQTFGLDISQEGNEICRQVLESWGTKPADLLTASMDDIPLADNSMDIIVDIFSSNCLETRGFERFLDEVTRILKPGGFFFSYIPSKNSDAFKSFAPAEKVDESTLNGIYRETSPYSGNHYNFRFITPNEYADFLKKRDFSIQYLETVGRTYRQEEEYFEFVTIEARRN